MSTLLPIALGLLLQSTALLLVGLVAMRLARRRGPAVQSLIGRATLAGVALALLLAGPLAGHVRPVWRVTVGEPTPRQVAAPPETGGGRVKAVGVKAVGVKAVGVKAVVEAYPLDGTYTPRAAFTNAPSKAPVDPAMAGPTRLNPATALPASPPPPVSGGAATCRGVGSLWAVGTSLLLLWLALCQCHLTRLRRQASPVTSGPAAETLAALTTRPALLLAHPFVRSPFLTGINRPAIFLPTAHETEFDPTALRAILAHELAHLARRDNAWMLAARLLTALLWPQPLLWVLCRRLEQTGEEACDQAVLAQDCPPHAYAECLLTLAERHPLGHRERALGVGVAPFRSSLGRRIGRILDKGTHAMSAVTLRLRLAAAALAIAAALGGSFLVSSAPAQSPGPATVTPTPEQQRFDAMRLQDAMNLKAIGIALTQCVQDHDEYLPDAAHWMDALSPYLKDKSVFFDPFQPGAKRYGYAFNRNCSRKPLRSVGYPDEVVFVFDSTLGTRNASDTGRSLRYTASQTHRLSNVLFVDGHVKVVSADAPPSFTIQPWRGPVHRLRHKAGQPQAPAALTRAHLQKDRALIAAFSASHPDPELSNARLLAGLTPVQGPGVVVTLRDSRKLLHRNMPPGVAPAGIIHDTDINQVVNELKAAGAEAVAVNDQRLVATSPIRCAGPTIFVNNMPAALPLVVRAIGDPKALAAALNLPGGVASQTKAFDPAMFSVREADTLTLPAYSGGSEPRYAKPVAAASLAALLEASRQRTSEIYIARALTQKRDQLEATLSALTAQANALTLQTQMLRPPGAQVFKGATPPLPHSARSRDLVDLKTQVLRSQLAAAQADLSQKEASGMTFRHPAVIAARQKVQALERAYQEQPIREKQEYVEEVHQRIRQQVAALAALASAEDAAAHQLNNVQRQRRQLQGVIAFLNAQIARHNAPASGR